MGKLKYVESENINNYLNNSNIKLSNEWVKNTAIADIVILFLAVVFFENKLVYGILFSIINMIVVISLVYYLRKINHSKKNIYLFSGIYSYHLSLCLAVFAYSLIEQIKDDLNSFLFLLLIFFNGLIALLTIVLQISKIYKNGFRTKSSAGTFVIGAVAIAGACFAKTLDNINFFYILSACVACCSLCFASSSHMFLRYYCCVVLEKRKQE